MCGLFVFLSVSAASVNYAACELEHLLLQITPELIFLRVTALIFKSSSSSPRIFAVTVIPTAEAASAAAVCGKAHYRREREKDAQSVLFTHLCISDGAQPEN